MSILSLQIPDDRFPQPFWYPSTGRQSAGSRGISSISQLCLRRWPEREFEMDCYLLHDSTAQNNIPMAIYRRYRSRTFRCCVRNKRSTVLIGNKTHEQQVLDTSLLFGVTANWGSDVCLHWAWRHLENCSWNGRSMSTTPWKRNSNFSYSIQW